MSRSRKVFCPQRFAGPSPPSASRLSTFDSQLSALTLVEMLVAMAITLVMMAAVVNLFANMGASVRNRRATIEMSGQLRMVRLRLHNDLVGATCPTLTWQRPGDDNGYLEIIEGQWSDKNPSGLLIDGNNDKEPDGLDVRTSLVPSSNAPYIPQDWVTDGGGLGDYDDILALTVRSEGEPFVGRTMEWKDPDGSGPEPLQWVPTTIESTLAEVIWYAVENPVDGSLGEPGMRTVYRRVLLIAPWVALPRLDSVPGTTSGMTVDEKILAFYRNFDISAQIYSIDIATGNLVLNTTGSLVPNALGDLTKRENRFAHRMNADRTAFGWPYAMDQNVIWLLPYDADNPPSAPPVMTSPLRPFGYPFEPSGATPERQGEDVMLSDVLAWDLRVYDPGAPIVGINGFVLEPSDAGWNPSANGATIVGYGSYVNLGWDPSEPSFYSPSRPPMYVYNATSGAPTPLFKEPHTPGWHPRNPTDTNTTYGYWATYDTWSFHYENDGMDQEIIDNPNLVDDNGAGIDQGTNGLDDDVGSGFINGVDDMGERETAPPYDVPLRGIQVKLRIYEPDTRNIRETTVTRNFVP